MDPHAGEPIEQEGAPLGQSRAAMIMIHGRNATPRNILDLVPRFDRPQFTYLAPAARKQTWYPYSFLAETSMNEPGLSSGLKVIGRMVADLVARGIGNEHILLLGFSQGACLAAEFAIRHPARYGGLIVLSGGLIGPPGTTWNEDGAFNAMPVFLGCSDVDPHIPRARVDESAAVFERMGAHVTKRLYPGMGHFVNEDEIGFARTMMDRTYPLQS
jgi:phospholipase/carboxylesterase